MPRYYFDTISAGNVTRDQVGIDLVDDGEARDEAIGLLPDMARHELPDGDQREFIASARNEQGQVVYEASLSLQGRWWPGRR